jgi:hypothetical protein
MVLKAERRNANALLKRSIAVKTGSHMMSLGAMPQATGLQEILNRCQRRIQVHSALRGFAETLCVLIACVLFVCLLDYLVVLPGIVRTTGLVTTVVLTAGVAWKRLIRPVIDKPLPEELAAAVDLSFPELHEAVATLVSIDSATAVSGESGSLFLRNQLEQYVQSQIGAIRPSEVVQGKATIKRWGLATISVLAILIPLLLWPSGSQLLLQRFVLPFANLAASSNLYFEVPGGNRTVAINSDVQFVAIPRWRTNVAGKIPKGIVVEMQVVGGIIEERPMTYDATTSQFTALLSDIRKSARYRVRGGHATTEWFDLTVAEPPRILTAMLQATPPAYCGRPMEMFDGVVGDIHVFEHSSMEITLTFNKPVQSVEMAWQTWTPISGAEETDPDAADVTPAIPAVLSIDGLSAQFLFDAAGSGSFEFQVTDTVGLGNLNEPIRRLFVSADTPPKLVVTGVSDGLEVRPDDVLPLNCIVTDDVGVGELELHIQSNADVTKIEPADGIHRGVLLVTHDFQIDLKNQNLKNGDTLTIKVKAADERPLPGPQVVWQGPWTIHIADDAEAIGRKALREADQKLIESLRGLEEQLEQDAKKAEELKDKLQGEPDTEMQQSLRDLSEKEQTQGRKLQDLSEQTATHPLMKIQAAKLTELAQQIRQDVSAKLDAAAYGRLAAAEKIQESADDLNRLREELHRTTDEVEKAAELEQELAELNRLALEAQQLANDSQKIQQQRKDRQPGEGQSPEELQKELDQIQHQLQQEQRALTDDLGNLLKRQQELLQAAREAQLDRAAAIADKAHRLAQQQQQLAEGINEETADESRQDKDDSERAAGNPSESSISENLLNELAKMTNAAHELAESVQFDSQADSGAKQQSMQAAKQADDSLRHAQAGRFRRAAERMRDVAAASVAAADQMKNDALQDRRGQLQQQQNSFKRMSETVQQLQGNDEAQLAAQQATQRKVAEAAEQLPTSLQELAERMNIPELGLQNHARPAQEAALAAREGAESGEAAFRNLDATELQPASQNAREAAGQLKAATELAQQAAEGHREPNARVPKDVGDNVAEALHSLKKAAENIDQQAAERAATEQSAADQAAAQGQPKNDEQPRGEDRSNQDQSGQPGEGEAQNGKTGESESGQEQAGDHQPGEGQSVQPGESQQPGQSGEGKSGQGQQPSSTQQLAEAAKSLEAAARGVLPNQFSPGQLSSDPPNSAGEPGAEGHVSEFDGQNPDATRLKGQGRQWGGLNDGLEGDVSDAGKEVLDAEYSELIRRYRRNLARTGQKSEDRRESEEE